MQSQYSFEAPVLEDQYHIQILKEKLTRTLPELLPHVVDEVAVAVKEHFVLTENGRSAHLNITQKVDDDLVYHRVDHHASGASAAEDRGSSNQSCICGAATMTMYEHLHVHHRLG